MVMDATANKPVTENGEYYNSRKPIEVKRYSPAEMHTLLTEVGRAEWFGRTQDDVEMYAATTPLTSAPSNGAMSANDPARTDDAG